jgi:membrane protein implicated in regulation of membrane protease activity
MPFRFYTNMLAQASRTAAAGMLLIGLLLIGFGMLIMALPELFAFLAAGVFFVAGAACAVVAVKLLWAQRRLNKLGSDDDLTAYRQNVRIHVGGPYEP